MSRHTSLVRVLPSWLCVCVLGISPRAFGEPPAATEGTAVKIAEPKSESETEAAGPLTKQDPALVFNRSVYHAARRGAGWLQSMQKDDGLFVYGWIPALNRPLPGNNYLRQAGAAFALARSAAFTSDDKLDLAAQQAILGLLATTTQVSADQPDIRLPSLAPADANPVGYAGLLLLAISELPNPGPSFLDQGEQLARFLVSRQRPDGSFNVSVSLAEDVGDDADAINYYPGEAMYGLLRSYVHRPEPWKVEAVKRSLEFYRKHWRAQPNPAFVAWQTSAFAEAFLLTGDAECRDFVFEMTDWILGLQYRDPEFAERGWLGGFADREHGQTIVVDPGASTGSFAEGLVDAYRAAKIAGDQARMETYREGLELALRFLMANQYSISAFSHFEKWFSRKLNGAVYASVVDGTVRIDYTQHAINAMFHYLTHVAEYRPSAAADPVPLQAN